MDQRINVRIIAANASIVSVIPIEDQQDCLRCQFGQGCGSLPWFRGLFRNNSILNFQQTEPPLIVGDKAQISLDTKIVNRLSCVTYGSALLVFISILGLTQNLDEWLQLLSAIVCMGLTFLFSHSYCSQLLSIKFKLVSNIDIESKPKMITIFNNHL